MEREALIQKENMSYEFPSGDSKIIVSPPSSSGCLMPGALHSGWAQPHQILAAPMSTSQALVHLFALELMTSKSHLNTSQEAVSDLLVYSGNTMASPSSECC